MGVQSAEHRSRLHQILRAPIKHFIRCWPGEQRNRFFLMTITQRICILKVVPVLHFPQHDPLASENVLGYKTIPVRDKNRDFCVSSQGVRRMETTDDECLELYYYYLNARRLLLFIFVIQSLARCNESPSVATVCRTKSVLLEKLRALLQKPHLVSVEMTQTHPGSVRFKFESNPSQIQEVRNNVGGFSCEGSRWI